MKQPKLMPGMTLDQQIQGTRAAIRTLRASRRGPIWLVPSLQKRLRALRAEQRRRERQHAERV
jgi:hypothetical protein